MDQETTISKEKQNLPSSWVSRNRYALIAVSAILLLFTFSGAALGVYTWDKGAIADGVSINGLSLDGLSQEQARLVIEKNIKSLLAKNVVFDVDNTKVQISIGQLGLTLSAEDQLEQASRIGRTGNIVEKAIDKRRATQGVNLLYSQSWDNEILKKTLAEAFTPYNLNPENATFTVTAENTMLIAPEKVGRNAELEILGAEVQKLDYLNPKTLTVSFGEVRPSTTAAQLDGQKFTGIVASYTTYFDSGQTNRAENIRVAAKALDGAVIKPEQIFSFNGTVGERSPANGYMEAPVIYDGELVPGMGGGVCQVSTTLYNVLLLADLPITERSNHSLAIHYAPMGQDATVSYPDVDLKFKNDTDTYLLVRTNVSGGVITIQLYGQPKPERNIYISNVIDTTLPAKERIDVNPTLPQGYASVEAEGAPGFIVSSTRTVKINGVVTKVESLGKSTYLPSPRIVVHGP